MSRKSTRFTSHKLPRSILSPLDDPLIDPRDGHGARSSRDVILLRKFKSATQGDDDALVELLQLVVKENLAEIKAARGACQLIAQGGGSRRIRSLVPVMQLLRMADVEYIDCAPEKEGHLTVTKRKRVPLSGWFEDYALGRDGVDPNVLKEVREWIAKGSIQRRDLGDWFD